MMTTSQQQSQPVGISVLREAAALLKRLRAGPGNAAGASGELVWIQISPLWKKDKTFHLSFTCMARGHQKVDWSRLHLTTKAASEESVNDERIQLNPRGQGWLKSCKPIEYTFWAFVIGDNFFTVRTPVRRTVPGELSPAGAEVLPGSDDRLKYQSPDGRLRVTLTAHETHLEIVCSTGAAELAGGTVVIRRRMADGAEPQQIGTVVLEAEKGQLWKGKCQVPNLTKEEELELEVIPPPTPSGEQP